MALAKDRNGARGVFPLAAGRHWPTRSDLYLRLVREHHPFDRLAYEPLPIHRPRIRHGNGALLLPRQILRPEHGKVYI